MTTNRDWLFSLPLEEQYAWMNAEHVQQPVTDASERVTNQADMLDDLRERLEADARKIADAYNMDSQRHGTERFAHELYYSIIHLLDRQAAITEREYGERMASEAMCSRICVVVSEQREQIAELTAERDKLQEINEYHALQYELASEDADEKWNLYVAEHGRADSNAADREMYRKTTTVLMDCITEGLRKVNAVLDGKDEGLA